MNSGFIFNSIRLRKQLPTKYRCLATTLHGITLMKGVILTCNNDKIYKNLKKRTTNIELTDSHDEPHNKGKMLDFSSG